MELKESIAHKTIYSLSMTYKIFFSAGILLFFFSVIMALLTIPDPESSLHNEFITNAILGYSFIVSVFLIITGFIFRVLRETVRVKTRSIRKRRCRT
jgi:uncharacterized BrkB/YihY/UPF0761 family membrane protein